MLSFLRNIILPISIGNVIYNASKNNPTFQKALARGTDQVGEFLNIKDLSGMTVRGTTQFVQQSEKAFGKETVDTVGQVISVL
jgi:hypothetical protein